MDHSSYTTTNLSLPSFLPHVLSNLDNNSLLFCPSDVDIWKLVFSISPAKAPRPDRFNATFYQKYLPALRDEVRQDICSFFQHNTLDTKLNCTNDCPYLETGGGNNTAWVSSYKLMQRGLQETLKSSSDVFGLIYMIYLTHGGLLCRGGQLLTIQSFQRKCFISCPAHSNPDHWWPSSWTLKRHTTPANGHSLNPASYT